MVIFIAKPFCNIFASRNLITITKQSSIMRKLLTFMFLISFCANTFAQGVIYENYFNGYGNYQHFPHDGWVEEGVDNALWQFSAHLDNFAGGDDSELLHYGSSGNPFTGMARAVSPIVDLTGHSVVKFNFLYGGKNWNPGFEIGVATRSGGGDWNVVWSMVNEDDISGETGSFEVNVIVDNEDIGQADVQYCFYFNGVNYDCKYLCFDNFVISEITQNDIYTSDVSFDTQVLSGEDLTVEGTYYNNGSASESFDALVNIYDITGNLLYSDTESINALESSAEITVAFDPYTVLVNNTLFTVEISHNLPNDTNPVNDTLSGVFNSYSTPRQLVLLEIGTATWCSGCPGVAMAADEFIENGKDVAVIEYHTSDNFAAGDVTVRFGTNYYNSYTFPTSVFDGIGKHIGGNATQSVYEDLLPYYEQRIEICSPLQLSFTSVTANQSDYEVSVNIEKIAPVVTNDYVVYLVLTESDIPYSWGQGLLDEVNFVERFMLPDVYGRAIDLQSNTNFVESFSFSLDTAWVAENCELVFFVQDVTTLEILQATKTALVQELAPYIHDFTLLAGWNDISTFVTPTTPDIETLFAPIMENITLFRNMTQVFWPEENINTIGSWDNNSGYVIKVEEDVDFQIPGSALANKELSLNGPGWYYMPVLSNCPVSIEELFGDQIDNVTIIAELIGTDLYWPEFSISTLNELNPGRAYSIKISSAITVNFPDCESK